MVGFFSFSRRMEMRAVPAAAPAIQINQHVPKRPVEVLREKPIPRATAS
jgi:hypothetical protein